MEGFFSSSEVAATARRPLALVPKCGACGLYKECNSPKLKPAGKGSKVLFVGDWPSADDDVVGKMLAGSLGRYLKSELEQVGLDIKKDCTTTYALICRPGTKPDNQFKGTMIDFCRPNLLKTIKEVNPLVIVPMGEAAVKSVIGHYWTEKCGGLERWAGAAAPSQELNAWVCPVINPNRAKWEQEKGKVDIVQRMLTRQLERVALLASGKRPWRKKVNYADMVEIFTDLDEAATAIRTFTGKRPVAFDYETNMLKPEMEGVSRILCASMSDGRRTIAFPMVGRNIKKTFRMFLRSETPKIAANAKFEDRWSRSFLKVNVQNWIWDTMLAVHVDDVRPGTAGLKYQSFAQFGLPDYHSDAKAFMDGEDEEGDSGYAVNKLDKMNRQDLLLYCGMDSLLEILLYYRQIKHQKWAYRRPPKAVRKLLPRYPAGV